MIQIILNYISVDDIISNLIKLVPGPVLCKIDIGLALHQLKVDNGDIDLLSLNLDSYYTD